MGQTGSDLQPDTLAYFYSIVGGGLIKKLCAIMIIQCCDLCQLVRSTVFDVLVSVVAFGVVVAVILKYENIGNNILGYF